jgi:hypothetical protein
MDAMLKELWFSEVNNAITNTLTTMSNFLTTNQALAAITLKQMNYLTNKAKGELKIYTLEMKYDIVNKAQKSIWNNIGLKGQIQ